MDEWTQEIVRESGERVLVVWGEELDGVLYGWVCERCGEPIPFTDAAEADTPGGVLCGECRGVRWQVIHVPVGPLARLVAGIVRLIRG